MSHARVAGHFGEWLQGRLGPGGPVVLVTLPCAALQVSAPGRQPPGFAGETLARFAADLGLSPEALPRGIDRNFPLGAGAGGSTATLIALARAAGFAGPPERLARACLAAEGASDPLMFAAPERLLWASRRGEILRPLPALPRAALLGGFWGPAQPTRPEDEDFDDIADLVAAWPEAAEAGDLPRLARLASHSARRCSIRRGPEDEPLENLAADLGALGWIRAHTGAARGLIFRPGAIPPHGAAALAEVGLRDVISFETGGDLR